MVALDPRAPRLHHLVFVSLSRPGFNHAAHHLPFVHLFFLRISPPLPSLLLLVGFTTEVEEKGGNTVGGRSREARAEMRSRSSRDSGPVAVGWSCSGEEGGRREWEGLVGSLLFMLGIARIVPSGLKSVCCSCKLTQVVSLLVTILVHSFVCTRDLEICFSVSNRLSRRSWCTALYLAPMVPD